MNEMEVLDINGSRISQHDLEERLLDEVQNGVQQVPATDLLYYLSFRNCEVIMGVLCTYSVFILFAIPLEHFTYGYSTLSYYFMYLFAVMTLRLYHYGTIKLALKSVRNYYLIAQVTEHMKFVQLMELPEHMRKRQPLYLDEFDIRMPLDPDNDKKLRVLSYDIKVLVINLNYRRKVVNKYQFLIYQVAHFVGIYILLFHQFEEGRELSRVIISIVILVGTYQYIQFYLLMVFLTIVLPYYFLRNTFTYLRRRYLNYKLQKVLKSERYSEKQMAGDKQCKICLMAYEQNERVITLPCNAMHNFHSVCLKEWTKQSITCPLCRANITDY